MITINFFVDNPLKSERWKNLYNKAWAITKNKTLEIQFFRNLYYIFSLHLDLCWSGKDHAGPCFEINILGLEFSIQLHDNRHWDYTNNCWENYERTNS